MSGRIRRNDSPTREQSEALEDKMHAYIETGATNPHVKVNVHTVYDIPYLINKEIKVKGVGRISTNALDSIAKYAGLAGIPLRDGLGLAAQETHFGAMPVYNFIDGDSVYNRILGNSSYFRNFGIIPAQYLVRDFEYDKGARNKNQPYDRSIPPLLHAFQYYKKGLYNRGDKNHTADVILKGNDVLKDANIKNWLIQTGDSIYNSNLQSKKSGGKLNYLNIFK